MSRHLAWQSGHHVRWLEGAQAWVPELLAAIDAAQMEVRMETYIFADDPVGEQVMQALLRAGTRGLAVYLVVDGVGTPSLPQRWVKAMAQAGVQHLVFRPVSKLGVLQPRQWRRLHRKLAVIDAEVVFCGGINVQDGLCEPGLPPLSLPRFDFAVRAQGPLVAEALRAMRQLWRHAHLAQAVSQGPWRAPRLLAASTPPPKPPRTSPPRPNQTQASQPRPSPASQALPEPAGQTAGMRAALLLRDNLRHRRAIERAYRRAIAQARHEVIIANAYFFPGRRLRQALVLAARRGVRVQLLLLAQLDLPLQALATRSLYRPLIAAGVDIHEYAPSYLHAKVAVIDGVWATVGSSNLDPLSLLLAREANVVVHDAPFARSLRDRLQQAVREDGRAVTLDALRPSLWRRAQEWLALALLRWLIALSGQRY